MAKFMKTRFCPYVEALCYKDKCAKTCKYAPSDAKEEPQSLKMYAFHPDGHGQDSVFVMAESLEKAYEYIFKAVEKPKENRGEHGVYPIDVEGIETDYTVTICDIGEVEVNAND